MVSYLPEILAAHRQAAARDGRDRNSLVSAASAAPPVRSLAGAIRAGGGLGVIAEIKRRSPSKGDLDPALVPAEVARAYATGGARALSVLTDAEYFGGSIGDLQQARAAVAVPVLRKDFTVAVNDVLDARIMGADALLLIVAALDDAELRELRSVASDVGIEVLVEVHDEIELDRALALDADLIGVNQRDLATFEVDGERAQKLAGAIPPSVVAVAESGIRHDDDAKTLAAVGFDAVLVGETLVRAHNRSQAVAALSGHRVGSRV